MKFLLTSTGLANDPIAQAFVDMSAKPMSELKVVFIPTAKNRNTNNTEYFAQIFGRFSKLGIKKVDIVDLEGLDKKYWLPRIEAADVIYIGGGNTYFLMQCLHESGLAEEMPRLLETKLYVGDSAGAIVVTPSLDIAAIDDGDENIVNLQDTSGLGLVDFEISPHTPEDVSLQGNERYATTTQNVLYAYDNQTALRVEGSVIQFVGTGEHHIYNQ